MRALVVLVLVLGVLASGSSGGCPSGQYCGYCNCDAMYINPYSCTTHTPGCCWGASEYVDITPNITCGNNKTECEPCDDGNLVNGDGCSSTCTIEAGYTCTADTTSHSTCVCNTAHVCKFKYPYVGCYQDNPSRDLPYLVNGNYDQATVEWCVDACYAAGYKYAGLQFGVQCFCGMTYGKYGSLAESSCSMTCGGNSNEKCGNGYVNSVYKIALKNDGYKGCYNDSSPRDLPYLLYAPNPAATVETCVSGCLAKNYSYAGMQFAEQCFCGNSYGRYRKLSESACSMTCTGDSSEFCGNGWTNSIYATWTRYAAYQGCFKDATPRDLSYQVSFPNSNNATIENCVAICKSFGYQYAAGQFGYQCWCGNKFGTYGSVPESYCNQTCAGNSQEYCGQSWTNSVYTTVGF